MKKVPAPLKRNPAKSKVLRPSSAADWEKKADESVIIPLPSGVNVKIRVRLGLIDFAMAGHIPLPLVKSVINTGEEMTKGMDSWDDIKPEKLTKMRVMLEQIAAVAIIEPKVVLDSKEDGILAEKISMEDLLFLFASIVGRGSSMQLLAPFRKK